MRVHHRPDLAVLRVEGDDARAWLNGQITNDVRATRPGDAVRALVLNVKGRILADVVVVDRGERGLAMIIPAAEEETLRTHLEKYVIMEDVTLVRDAAGVAELHGEGEVAGECFTAGWLGAGVRVRLGEADALATLPSIGDSELELERVRAGRPAFGADFGPTTYPQEAGLESAVSFQKGCYLGQEVVCMLENRGKLNRRLVRLATDAAVPVGAKVIDATGAELGAITSAVATPEGKGLALGYVKRVAIEDQRALAVEGRPATVVG